MAVLENQITKEKITLRAYHIVGRRKTSVDTYLKSKVVSYIHASFRWENTNWKILDQSRNGTWLNGSRLSIGKATPLEEGNTIRFGATNESAWRVINLGAPKTSLVPLQEDSAVIELGRLNALPDEQNPEIVIYSSQPDQWICETPAGSTILSDGEIIRFEDKLWRFYQADMVASTLETEDSLYYQSEPFNFQFQVSLDEEHIFLKINKSGQVIDLGERVHHYLSLTLARKRLEDAENRDSIENQGWIDVAELSDLLKMEETHLNIWIHRIRKQIAESLPEIPHLPQIIERRSGSIRFGYAFFSIFKDTELEGQLNQEESHGN